ncbi:MAG: endonuclease III domain-containing protein [Symbiobacteriia bacterium]
MQTLVDRDWDRLPDLDTSEIAAALHGSGLEEIRARHIREVAVKLRDHFGSVTLEPLRSWPDDECTRFLTALPGVGTKTALCVEMYALDRQVFPADAHCIRVLKRLGVVPPYIQHRPAQRLLANVVPAELSYKLHVNLVAHGQQVCRPRQPRCNQCVVRGFFRIPMEQAEAAAEVSPTYPASTR